MRHRIFLERARSYSVRRVSSEERVVLKLISAHLEDDPDKPRTRADCANVPRPCPYVSCRHHLYLDVATNGTLRINFPDRDPDEMSESCSLDVSERGPNTLDDVGALMNVTRERVRQIEELVFRKFARLAPYYGVGPTADDDLKQPERAVAEDDYRHPPERPSGIYPLTPEVDVEEEPTTAEKVTAR